METTTIPGDAALMEAGGKAGRRCPGCPRCVDANAGFCRQVHRQYRGMHPVCKRCGHCVLRGNHDDDMSDVLRD